MVVLGWGLFLMSEVPLQVWGVECMLVAGMNPNPSQVLRHLTFLLVFCGNASIVQPIPTKPSRGV